MKKNLLILLCAVSLSAWAQTTETLSVSVATSSDDAEELSVTEQNSELNAGDLDLASSDLELLDDASWNGTGLTVGVRFRDIDLPKGTVITSAHIEFVAKSAGADASALTIEIEDAANGATFVNESNNITSRTTTSSSVAWNETQEWTAGEVYQTADLKVLVDEVMGRSDWEEGGSFVFIISGSAARNVQSFDGSVAPKLVLEYDPATVVYLPKLVQPIADQELGTGWDFELDLAPFFSDKDDEIVIEAVETGETALPTWLTLNNGVLSGMNNTAEAVSITVTANGGAQSISEEFMITTVTPGAYTLALFHNNDGESHLLAEEVEIDGQTVNVASVGQFKSTLDSMRMQATSRGYNSVMLSSGDNFLAGLEYNASVANGVSYDAIALDSMNYDAIDLGNHDFDFGTQALADLINAFQDNKAPYLSSNLGFENVPELKTLQDQGRIKPYTIVTKGGEDIGVIGLTTPLLPTISSPGNTVVSEAIVDSVQKYVDEIEGMGINKIILISHLQGLSTDLDFVKEVDGVDIVIAGGGDELLANDAQLGAPFKIDPYDTYPIVAQDKSGDDVYIVTTPGGYRFLGNLVVDFDANGVVTRVYPTNPILVKGSANQGLVDNVETPIENYIGALATNVIAVSEVALDFRRESLRVKESNGGNLMADAVLYQAQKDHAGFGVKEPMVAIQNAGGLRIESEIAAGDFTEDLTYKIAAFDNIVSVVEDIAPEKFLELIEHGIANTPNADGRFPQIAGFKIVFDPTKDGGSRVKSIELDNGTMIIENGEVAASAPDVTLATINFTAGGGDGYPFDPLTYKTLGATYQQALYNYLVSADALNGQILATDYPVDMNERIIEELSEIPPVTALLLDENFDGCDLGLAPGWTSYSVTSNANWDCSDDGRGASGNAGDYGIEMNGYGADVASDDWLITPAVELNGGDYYFSFNSMSKWSGPHIEVLYSADYAGGDPSAATWTNFTEAEDVAAQNDSYDYVESGDLEVSGLTGTYHFAFRYTSTGTGGGEGTTYRIDDVKLRALNLLYEDFNDVCTGGNIVPEGWTLFETETQGLTECNSTGYEDDANDFSIGFNGYGVGAGEAWLITPRLDLSAAEYVLTFASRDQYSGPDAQIFYSIDYVGVGNPNDANWTELQEGTDAITGSFQLSGEIDLSAITAPVYFAVKYTSLGTSGGESKRLYFDEFLIQEPAKIVDQGELTISEIQGTVDETPYLNAIVKTRGVVTAIFDAVKPYPEATWNSNIAGFFMQDRMGDGNPATSDGIFVYSSETVAVGDSVLVDGQVAEYYGSTQLGNVTSVDVLASGIELPAPVEITLPLASKDEFEAFESMLVEFSQELTVTENRNIDIYGELMLSSGGVLYQPTQIVDVNDADADMNSADGLSNLTAVNDYLAANNANYVFLDDARSGDFQEPYPFVNAEGYIRAGSKVNNVSGVLTYSFSQYRVYPTQEPMITYEPREELSDFTGATVKVATFNVQNFFNGDGQGGGFPTSRGATTEEDFVKQTQKIVAAIEAIDADVVGLIEIENDADNGFSAMKTLVDSLNGRMGASYYDWVKTGVVGGDEIKNGFIFKTATIALAGDYEILDNSFDANYFEDYNRPGVTQTFEEIATGEKFTAVINHLKSKGSGCDAVGDPNLSDGQGNCNGTRTMAAGTMASWLESDPTLSNDNDVLILGDLNAYYQEDPIDTLRSRGFEVLFAEDELTYYFDGQAGALDYALANSSLVDQVTETFVWHINSPEQYGLTYDKAGDSFTPDAWRSSDHDPVIVGLKLNELATATSELAASFAAYPNPTTGLVNFTESISGTVYNALGQVVVVFENATSVDLSSFETGIYHVSSVSGEAVEVIVE